MREKLTKGELTKKILLGVAATAAVGVAVTALAAFPGLGLVSKQFLARYHGADRKRRYQVRKTFARLRRDRLIALTEKNG